MNTDNSLEEAKKISEETAKLLLEDLEWRMQIDTMTDAEKAELEKKLKEWKDAHYPNKKWYNLTDKELNEYCEVAAAYVKEKYRKKLEENAD